MYQKGGIEKFCEGYNPFLYCIEKVSAILANEGFRRTALFAKETALNLDAVERRSNVDERDRTFDFVIAVEKDKLLLTEAKLRISEMTSNTVSNVIGKVAHSKDILVSCPGFNFPFKLHEKMVVLIPDANFHSNRNKFHRYMQEKSSRMKITVFRVSDYYDTFIKA